MSSPAVPYGTGRASENKTAPGRPRRSVGRFDGENRLLQSALLADHVESALQAVVNRALERELRQCFKLVFAQLLNGAQEERLDLESRRLESSVLVVFVVDDVIDQPI